MLAVEKSGKAISNYRILVADDEKAYLNLFVEVLSASENMEFELVTCERADEAVNSVKRSIEQNQCFAVAFIDIRMPSGPDGLWAAKKIREIDPNIEIVIITGHSDYDLQEIISYVPPVHKLIYLQKPFYIREIQHFAHVLCSKWQHEINWIAANASMERVIDERTKKLTVAAKQLEQEVLKHKQTAEFLKKSEERLHILSANLLTAQEEERKLIAMELHDDFGQTLNVIKLNLRYILDNLPNSQANLENECEKSIQHVRQVLEKIRRLSHGLTPAELDDLGLSTAIIALMREFSNHSEIKISYDFEEIDSLFPSTAGLIIYRLFQEVFMNIHKHSKADNVSAVAKKEEKHVTFTIEDNGKGFDMNKTEFNSSFKNGIGFASMRERVRMLKGHLEIYSHVAKGTKITFKIPYFKRNDQ